MVKITVTVHIVMYNKKKPIRSKHKQNSIPNDEPPEFDPIRTEYESAMKAYDRGEYTNAMKHFGACLSAYKNGNIEDPETLANIFLGMGVVYYAQVFLFLIEKYIE